MDEGLLELAKRYERQKLKKNKTMFLELSPLEILLNDVYETHRPSSQDYDSRRNLIRIFNEIAREIYGDNDKCPVVKEFGSYLMELFDASSDLDLSINFLDNEEKPDRAIQVKTLRKFANKLYALQRSKLVSNVQLILSARVPVLKATDCGTKVECDLSVGNLDGIEKSQIVLMISAIDGRFQKLCVLMKVWAKANDINSAKEGTINSLSLILLVAFHLQTRDIPILPPFSAILKDGLDPAAVNKNIQDYLNYGESNKESLAELFVSMLIKLESVEGLWFKGLCASTYEGSWISKTLGCVSIEDFADRSQNTCRALKIKNKVKVYSCISGSIKQILLFTKRKVDATELKNLLFKGKPKTRSEVAIARNNKPTGKRKRKQQAQMAAAQSKETNFTKKKRGGPSNTAWVGTSNVTSTSYGGIDKSQEVLIGVCHQLLLAANALQGSGGVRSQRNHVEPLPHASQHTWRDQQISMSNTPIQRWEGVRPDTTQARHYHHAAPSLMPGPSQGFTGFGQERTHAGTPLSYPGMPPPASAAGQGFGGYRQERTHTEDLNHVSPRFPVHQGFGGYRQERTHTEDLNHVSPRFPADQGFGGYRQERTHVEHFRHAPEFSDRVSHSLASRSGHFMPPHQPHLPSPHLADPRWSERPYDSRVFPSVPPQYAQSSHAPGNRESSSHQEYQPRGNGLPPRLPFPRF